MPRRRLLVLLLSLLPWGTTAPAAPPASPEITAAIRQLGDDNYVRREEATQFLWESGVAAAPALEAAAVGTNPEIRGRAQQVLEKLHGGIYPNTRPGVIALVKLYRAADTVEARQAIATRLTEQDGDGLVALTRLAASEPDAALKGIIYQFITARPDEAAEAAAVLLANREPDAARLILEQAVSATGNETAVRAYAAYLLSAGKLPDKIADRESSAAIKFDPKGARELALLHRAAGELDAAQGWAEKIPDNRLTENLLLERHDWTGLARTLGAGGASEDVRRTGFVAAVQRFAGDRAGFAASLGRLRLLSKRTDTQGQAAMAFLLNDQVDDALAIFLDRKAYLNAFELYVYMSRFAEAIALVDRAAKEGHPDALVLKAVAVRTLSRLGERDKAEAFLAEATAENAIRKDFALAGNLCAAEMELGRPDRARDRVVDALTWAKPNEPRDDVRWLLAKFFPGNELSADAWWHYVQDHPPGKSKAEVLDRVAAIVGKKLPPGEFVALAADAVKAVGDSNDDVRQTWLQLMADELRAVGRPDAAGPYLDQLTALWAKREEWTKVGDRLAEQTDWLRAADYYHRAAFRPSDAPEDLWLQGYALAQGGRVKDGRALMELAKTLPLADERRRYALADVMAARHQYDDARDQRELILRTGQSRGWSFYDSAKQLGNDAARRGDYAKASEYWRVFLLQVLDDGGEFLTQTAYLDVSQLVHRNRGRGLINHGDAAAAMTELRASLVNTPAGAQTAIDFVPELDKTGHRAEGDELFGVVRANLQKITADFPRSFYYHNDLAWACTLCNREPELALAHARTAAELAPADTNCLDTLAEVYFRAGRTAEAQAVMQKCIALEPKQDRHRQRLEGFKAGKGFSP